MSTIKDLSVEELKALIEGVVEEKLSELVGDPDEGLILRPEVEKRLRKSLRTSKSRSRVPAAEVARRLGLVW